MLDLYHQLAVEIADLMGCGIYRRSLVYISLILRNVSGVSPKVVPGFSNVTINLGRIVHLLLHRNLFHIQVALLNQAWARNLV